MEECCNNPLMELICSIKSHLSSFNFVRLSFYLSWVFGCDNGTGTFLPGQCLARHEIWPDKIVSRTGLVGGGEIDGERDIPVSQQLEIEQMQ